INDPDPQVRATALCFLGTCYHFTNDVRIGRLLATIVSDEQEISDIRISAYGSLYYVRGDRYELWPGQFAVPPTAPRQRRIPEDIDWSYVNSFFATLDSSSTDGMKRLHSSMTDDEHVADKFFANGEKALQQGRFDDALVYLTKSLEASSESAGTL